MCEVDGDVVTDEDAGRPPRIAHAAIDIDAAAGGDRRLLAVGGDQTDAAQRVGAAHVTVQGRVSAVGLQPEVEPLTLLRVDRPGEADVAGIRSHRNATGQGGRATHSERAAGVVAGQCHIIAVLLSAGSGGSSDGGRSAGIGAQLFECNLTADSTNECGCAARIHRKRLLAVRRPVDRAGEGDVAAAGVDHGVGRQRGDPGDGEAAGPRPSKSPPRVAFSR